MVSSGPTLHFWTGLLLDGRSRKARSRLIGCHAEPLHIVVHVPHFVLFLELAVLLDSFWLFERRL